MSARNAFDFLRNVAARADLLDALKTKSKEDVIAAAGALGFPFEESEFDWLVWDLEARIANKRGEAFDAQFSLWHTLWGQYYLEFLVTDMITSLDDADFEAVLAARRGWR